MTKPQINVTPLIDVLLVLLIIFMVVAPLKPASFKARVPTDSKNETGRVNDHALVVTVDTAANLHLNGESGLGTPEDTDRLIARLKAVFVERIANGDISESFADDPQRPFSDRAERTVFIKAPRDVASGRVAKIVDAVKLAGAYPISL